MPTDRESRPSPRTRGYTRHVTATVTVTTYVDAARLTGMSPSAIARRVRVGLLAPGPWTVEQLRAHIAEHPLAAHPRPRARVSPVSEWRAGARTVRARRAHVDASREYRRDLSRAEMPPWMQQVILDRVSDGELLGDVLEEMGIPQQRVWHRAWWDEEWAERLEDALMVGRDPAERHGTASAYKRGCRCRDCRPANCGPGRS